MRICRPSQINARVQATRPPRISTTSFIPSTRHIYVPRPVQYRTSLCLASSSSVCRLVCDFCSSGREFASSFFQIPPRDGHPCSSLTVPTAKSVVDFHHQVVVHAAHTKKRRTGMANPSLHLFFGFILPAQNQTTRYRGVGHRWPRHHQACDLIVRFMFIVSCCCFD